MTAIHSPPPKSVKFHLVEDLSEEARDVFDHYHWKMVLRVTVSSVDDPISKTAINFHRHLLTEVAVARAELWGWNHHPNHRERRWEFDLVIAELGELNYVWNELQKVSDYWDEIFFIKLWPVITEHGHDNLWKALDHPAMLFLPSDRERKDMEFLKDIDFERVPSPSEDFLRFRPNEYTPERFNTPPRRPPLYGSSFECYKDVNQMGLTVQNLRREYEEYTKKYYKFVALHGTPTRGHTLQTWMDRQKAVASCAAQPPPLTQPMMDPPVTQPTEEDDRKPAAKRERDTDDGLNTPVRRCDKRSIDERLSAGILAQYSASSQSDAPGDQTMALASAFSTLTPPSTISGHYYSLRSGRKGRDVPRFISRKGGLFSRDDEQRDVQAAIAASMAIDLTTGEGSDEDSD